jgi:hypothetical protein
MHPFRAHLIVAIVAVAALAITGCSASRLAYQQADWLLLREVDSYLDLKDGQHEQVARALKTHLSRHRTEHLPGFAKALGSAASKVRRGLSEADVRWALENGRALYAGTVELMLPTLASALADLNSEQRQHLAQRMTERNDEYIDRHALLQTSEEQSRHNAARSVDRIEQWTGTLSPEQIAMVHEANRALPDITADWLSYTKDRQQGLLALLDAGASRTVVETFLRGWWISRNALPPQLAEKRDQRIEARITLIARLDSTLDSVQREHFVDRLQDLADDAQSLMHAA